MELDKINANMVGGIGAFIFLITGIVSGAFGEYFSRQFGEGHPLALWDTREAMLDNTSPYLFAVLITLLLIGVFGGVFALSFESFKQRRAFEESGKTWEEWTYKSA